MLLVFASLLRMEVVAYEHTEGTAAVVEVLLVLQLLVAAALLVAPPAEGHLEAVQVVE